jgi:hypothetical protein
MAVPFSGGCICGAVRYECLAEPVVSGFCHCRDCQRETGSAFGTTLFVPRNAVTIVGEVKYYDGKGDSGNIVSRGFCPTCGARLWGNRRCSRNSWPLERGASTIRVGFDPRGTSMWPAHSRGIS